VIVANHVGVVIRRRFEPSSKLLITVASNAQLTSNAWLYAMKIPALSIACSRNGARMENAASPVVVVRSWKFEK
jgi:hypothetical protein